MSMKRYDISTDGGRTWTTQLLTDEEAASEKEAGDLVYPAGQHPEFNAGYEIIQAETYNTLYNGTTYHVVLGRRPTQPLVGWVTWECVRFPGHEESYAWGHYFDGHEMAARADFHSRLWEKYNNRETYERS